MKTKQFVDALRQIEDQGQLDPMVALFTDDAELWNPELPRPLKGKEGARQFWREYKATFSAVHSEFCSIIEEKNKAALEWESTGTLEVQNQPICYRGVSIVDWSDDQITRFAAYFDPRMLFEVKPLPAEVRQVGATGQRKARGTKAPP